MRDKNSRSRRRPLLMLLLLAAVALCCWRLGDLLPESRGVAAAGLGPEQGPAVDTAPGEWNLILVNSSHPLPLDYQVELLTLDNGEQVDERIYPDLQAMFDAAREEGLALFVAAGFRTYAEQQQLMDEKIGEYRAQGYPIREAAKLARQWVAQPGASEHQLGIAVDINADLETSSSDEVYAWLEANAYKYGFTHRYPADKTAVTGIIYEPWHYRYVGYEAALAMHSQGLCLEEYLQTLE